MKEEEIRKRDIFNKYLELAGKDAENYFSDRSSFIYLDCPACGGHELKPEFEKNNFKYVSCGNCRTLFVNPRPAFEALKKFYTTSPSTEFWVNRFFKPTAESRREKIFRPRAESIAKMIGEGGRYVVGDIGAGFGLFLEELKKLVPRHDYIAIEPSCEMADICRAKGFKVEPVCVEELSGQEGSYDVLTAFELLEHLFDAEVFLRKAYLLLKPGGRLFLTTLNGRGFDILLLWDKSKAIMPPHHINFFNPYSLRHLLQSLGYKDIEVSTPGRLDWDIVEGMIKNEGVSLGRFWTSLSREGSDASKRELQKWISRNFLSSHMMVCARR